MGLGRLVPNPMLVLNSMLVPNPVLMVKAAAAATASAGGGDIAVSWTANLTAGLGGVAAVHWPAGP